MKRTGVIVGIDPDVTVSDITALAEALERAFPGVKFAVVTGADSVAFEYSPPTPAPIGEPVHLDPEYIDQGSGDYFGLWPRKGRK